MIGIIIYAIIMGYALGCLISCAIINECNYPKPYVIIIWPIVLLLFFFKYTIKAFKALPEIWKM